MSVLGELLGQTVLKLFLFSSRGDPQENPQEWGEAAGRGPGAGGWGAGRRTASTEEGSLTHASDTAWQQTVARRGGGRDTCPRLQPAERLQGLQGAPAWPSSHSSGTSPTRPETRGRNA